jgi:hypothetical protein
MGLRRKETDPLYTVTNYFLFFGFLIALCIIDFNIVHFLDLQIKRLGLAIEKFFFRIKLEFDIFIIKYNKRKYLKMAQEILKDLQKDEQVQS